MDEIMSFSALFTPCLFDADRAQWIDSSVDANGPFFKSGADRCVVH